MSDASDSEESECLSESEDEEIKFQFKIPECFDDWNCTEVHPTPNFQEIIYSEIPRFDSNLTVRTFVRRSPGGREPGPFPVSFRTYQDRLFGSYLHLQYKIIQGVRYLVRLPVSLWDNNVLRTMKYLRFRWNPILGYNTKVGVDHWKIISYKNSDFEWFNQLRRQISRKNHVAKLYRAVTAS